VLYSEPALPCYVFADCPRSARLTVTVSPHRAKLHRRTALHFLVTVDIDGVVLPVPGANVWVGNGRHLHTADDGRAVAMLAFGKAGHRRVIATSPEYFEGRTAVSVTPLRVHP
jgi:hypothetical protein